MTEKLTITEAQQMKRCPKCGKTKPVSEFGKNASRPDGFTDECRECRNIRHREWYASKRGKSAPPQSDSDNPLIGFSPRELMSELKRRGYSGSLTFTKTVNLDRL